MHPSEETEEAQPQELRRAGPAWLPWKQARHVAAEELPPASRGLAQASAAPLPPRPVRLGPWALTLRVLGLARPFWEWTLLLPQCCVA